MLEIGSDGLRRGLQPAPIPVGPRSIAIMLDALVPGENIALIDRNGSLNYREFIDRVHAAAIVFQSLGVEPGSIVSAAAANVNEVAIAFFASQRLGAIWVGINPPLAAPEKAAQLADCGATHFFGDDRSIPQIESERVNLPRLQLIMNLSGPASEFSRLIDDHCGERVTVPLPDPLAPAVIGYTSGTTGLPKGVVHSQHNIMSYINACLASDEGGQWLTGARRTLSVPITNPNGMIYGPLVAISAGGSFVAIDRSDAQGVGEWIDRHQAEVLNSTPTTLRDLLFKPDLQHITLKSLKAVAVGGSPPTPDIMDAFRQRFGFELIADYGMTEAPSSIASSLASVRPPVGSTGKAHAHVQLAIMTPQGEPVPQGVEGELCVAAPDAGPWAGVFTAMLGYWNKPEETRAAFHDGRWLRTGDMGVLDDAGNLTLVGRKKEMILRGGANIYPAEIEQVLRVHDKVEDLVVKGLSDDRLGEIVAAYIKVREGVDLEAGLGVELRSWCLTRLARYKTPERWFTVSEIPRNVLNKPMRDRLDTVVTAELSSTA